MNTARRAASGWAWVVAAVRRRASRSSCTASITASQIAALLSKWRNTAPCVMPTAWARSAVVTSAGLRCAARASAAATRLAWRCSVACLGVDGVGMA